MSPQKTRRALLYASGTAASALLAGCGGIVDGSTDEQPDQAGNGADTTAPATTDGSTPEAETAARQTTAESEQVVRVNAMLDDSGAALFRKQATQYESSRDVDVQLTALSSEGTPLQSLPTKNDPALFAWAHDAVHLFKANEALSTDVVGASTLDPFIETARTAATVDGDVVGVPYRGETVALLYNRSLVDSPPGTVEGLVSQAESHHDPASDTYGLSYPINTYFVSGYAQAFGTDIYDPAADELAITSDAVREGLGIVVDKFAPLMPEELGYGPQVEAFKTGNAPFMINGPWAFEALADADLDYGVTTLPVPAGGKPRPYAGIELLHTAAGVADQPERASAAEAFARYFATETSVRKQAATQRRIVPVTTELDGASLPADLAPVREQLTTATPIPAARKMQAVWDPVTDAVEAAIGGSQDLDTALGNAADRIRSQWE